MTTAKTESIYIEKTPRKEVDTPIATAFKKVRNVRPLLTNELLRKRRRVKRGA